MDPRKVYELLTTAYLPQLPYMVINPSPATYTYACKLIQNFGNRVLPPNVASEVIAARSQTRERLRKSQRTVRAHIAQGNQQELQDYGNDLLLEFFLKGVLSSFRAFPPELLNLIFTYACAGSNDWKTRFILTRVCQKWRQVAFETYQLWTRIDIEVVKWGSNQLRVFGMNDVPAYFRECIRRAKGRAIVFQWNEEYVDLSRVGCNWLQTLGPSLTQTPYKGFAWATPSHCKSKFSSLFNPVLVHLRNKSQNSLKGLSLSNYDPIYSSTLSDIDPRGSIDLTAFGKLSKLEISLSSSFHSETLKVRESLLTVLSITTGKLMWQVDILNMLKRCTNLESCTLKSEHFERDGAIGFQPSIAPRVCMPKLHTLHLSCKIHMMFLGLLDTMETPSLERLTIHLKCDSNIISSESFIPFFSQCTKLEYLWISGIGSRKHIVDVLAPTLPRLRQLTILVNGRPFDTPTRSKSVYEALDALRVQPRKHVMFPNLVYLHLICHADQKIIHILHEIVTSRRWHEFYPFPGQVQPRAHLTITNGYKPTRHSLPMTQRLPLTMSQSIYSRQDPMDFSSSMINCPSP